MVQSDVCRTVSANLSISSHKICMFIVNVLEVNNKPDE